MKKLLIVIGAVVLLVIVAGAVAPFFISADAYKDQLVSRIRDATGRDLKIAGPVSLSLFPDVRLEASEVSLANPPGTQLPSLAAVKKLAVAVRLIPLLSGRIEIERLVLTDPTIDLEIDAQGKPNWDFGGTQATTGDNPSMVGLDALTRLRVTEVTIENGDIVLLDRRRNEREELTQGAVTVSAPNLDAPFTLSGSALWRGEKIDFSAKLDTIGALIRAGGKTGFTASLAAKPLTLKFTGSMSNAASGPVFDGNADLAAPSVRELIKWSGRDIVLPKQGFGALSLSGAVHAEARVATFSNAKFSLDSINATGTVALDMTDIRPAISAKLQTGMLDLNPYLPPPVTGWSRDNFDVAMFRGVNAEVSVAAQGVKLRHLQIGKTDVAAHLKTAKLTLDVTQMVLYRGSGKAQIHVDATGPTAAVQIDGALSGIDAGTLARDAAGIGGLSGTGSFTIAGTARGNSEADLIASLGGKASLRLSNGSVGGVDLGGMLKNTKSAYGSAAGHTAISRASASYTISRGTMRNSDLFVTAEGIDATGAGTIDLPARTLNYRVTPKLIAGIVTVPVIVSGPWDHLSYQPDIAGIVGGVVTAPVKVLGGAAGGAGKVGQSLGNGVGGALKGLFGN